MSGSTPINGYPYLLPTDPADISLGLQQLASAVDTRSVPRFVSTAARDVAIPSPVPGMVCAVTPSGGQPYLQLMQGGWQSLPLGLVAQTSGPSLQTDRTTTFGSIAQITVPMVGGRTYEVCVFMRATQITADGIPVAYLARSSDGTNEVATSARILDGTLAVNAGAFVSGKCLALISPGSTAPLTFYVMVRDTVGALRFSPNSVYMWVKDIGGV